MDFGLDLFNWFDKVRARATHAHGFQKERTEKEGKIEKDGRQEGWNNKERKREPKKVRK